MPSDQEKNAAADSAQPILVVEQQMGNCSDSEPRYDPENGIGRGGAKTRNKADELALEDGAADAHDADRADRNGNHQANHDAL